MVYGMRCGIDTWNKFVVNEGLVENRKYKYKYLLDNKSMQKFCMLRRIK